MKKRDTKSTITLESLAQSLEDLAHAIAVGFQNTATKDDIAGLETRLGDVEARVGTVEIRLVHIENRLTHIDDTFIADHGMRIKRLESAVF
jgi:hypothetical protein